MLEIRIQYKVRNDSEVKKKDIQAEDYFNPLQEGENYVHDGVPKYNQAWKFTEYKPFQLEWVEIYLKQGENILTKTRSEYFEGGSHSFIQRIDRDGYEILIHSVKLRHNIEQIIRTVKKGANADWRVESIWVGAGDESKEETWFDLKREKIPLENFII